MLDGLVGTGFHGGVAIIGHFHDLVDLLAVGVVVPGQGAGQVFLGFGRVARQHRRQELVLVRPIEDFRRLVRPVD